MAKNSSWPIIPSITDLLTNISTQSSLFLVKCNNLLCFLFLVLVSCCRFIIISKDKEVVREKIEMIKPTNCLSVLTCAKMFVPENTVKTRVKILLA